MAQRAIKPRFYALALFAVLLLVSACTLPTAEGDQESGDDTEITGPPVVELVSPQANATYLEGTPVNIQARVSNAGPDVIRIDVTLDDVIIGSKADPNPSGAASFPVTMDWQASGTGSHAIAVTAFREDGTASNAASATINVVQQDDDEEATPTTEPLPTNTPVSGDTSGNNDQQQPSPTKRPTRQDGSAQQQPTVPSPGPQQQPTQPSQQQPTRQPTEPPPPTSTPTSSVPTARMDVGVNVRAGDGTIFGRIGSLAANDESEILAVNPAGDWYKIRYYNGEGWVYAPLVTTSGNMASVPTEQGPPTPTPTPIPATATPTTPPSNVDLVAELSVSPHPLVCNEASNITVTVRNNGSEASSGGRVSIQAVLASSGAVLETTESVFGQVPAGGTATAQAALTVSVNYSELQRIVVEVDSDGQITESNENNNTATTDYVLAKGSCP